MVIRDAGHGHVDAVTAELWMDFTEMPMFSGKYRSNMAHLPDPV
jgi:hypothetical protein